MTDETFGEVEYCEDYGYIAHKDIVFGGNKLSVEITIMCDEEEEGIEQFQRDAFEALLEDWDEMQHKIAKAILDYYNDEEKESYGPEDEEEFKKWWPDIDTEEEMMKILHLDSIIIGIEYVMESMGENPVYILFDRDWGGDDTDDNGVAVLVADGEVAEVGYKDIAF